MIAKIICPGCQTLGQFSVEEGNYKGPYRCWKCKSIYALDMMNNKVISMQPMTEEEFKELKAKQDAQKRGLKSPEKSQSTPQTQVPPEPENNPVIWPKVSNKMIAENQPPEPPKQSFTWPKISQNQPNRSIPLEKPSPISKTPDILHGDKTPRKSNGVILFPTITALVEAEKLLNNEGCTIARITAPVNQSTGSNIALRFPWSQYETVKSLLEKAGVKTQGIIQILN